MQEITKPKIQIVVQFIGFYVEEGFNTTKVLLNPLKIICPLAPPANLFLDPRISHICRHTLEIIYEINSVYEIHSL